MIQNAFAEDGDVFHVLCVDFTVDDRALVQKDGLSAFQRDPPHVVLAPAEVEQVFLRKNVLPDRVGKQVERAGDAVKLDGRLTGAFDAERNRAALHVWLDAQRKRAHDHLLKGKITLDPNIGAAIRGKGRKARHLSLLQRALMSRPVPVERKAGDAGLFYRVLPAVYVQPVVLAEIHKKLLFFDWISDSVLAYRDS